MLNKLRLFREMNVLSEKNETKVRNKCFKYAVLKNSFSEN